jgi:hypothetical protein
LSADGPKLLCKISIKRICIQEQRQYRASGTSKKAGNGSENELQDERERREGVGSGAEKANCRFVIKN